MSKCYEDDAVGNPSPASDFQSLVAANPGRRRALKAGLAGIVGA